MDDRFEGAVAAATVTKAELQNYSYVADDIYIRHGRSLAACPEIEAEMLRMISAHNERPLRGYSSLHD